MVGALCSGRAFLNMYTEMGIVISGGYRLVCPSLLAFLLGALGMLLITAWGRDHGIRAGLEPEQLSRIRSRCWKLLIGIFVVTQAAGWVILGYSLFSPLRETMSHQTAPP